MNVRGGMKGASTPIDLLESGALPECEMPAGAAGALAGALAASILSTACRAALDDRVCPRTEEELRSISDRALSLRRDLLTLLEQGVSADRKVAAALARPGSDAFADPGRIRALLFASEVPLKTAQSCHVLLSLSERALDRIGMVSIPEIGTASALAFAGVTAGVVVARAWLAGIPGGSGTGAAAARKRAETILTEAEATRAVLTDRVRRHLP